MVRRYAQPDPDDIEIEAVHCFGCGRKVGVAYRDAPRKMEVHCEELCWYQEQLPSLEHAARDRFIRVMAELGVTQTEIGATFGGMTRPRIHQILVQGNNEDYLQYGRRALGTDEQRAAKARSGQRGGNAKWAARK